MKINEKNLSAYAVSSSPIDKEGYLNTRNEVSKSFQRRYFVLKGNLLFYFDKKGDKEPSGVIILEGYVVELVEDEEHFSFRVLFHSTNRSYIFATETQESLEQWMKALACASYDYMKLMVLELQRQLDEMDETPPTTPQLPSSPVPPPRHRHNPFNKPDSPAMHQRSHSFRSHSAKSDEPRWSDSAASNSKVSISFRELHNAYGRPILQDYNIWKNEHKRVQEKLTSVNNLITF